MSYDFITFARAYGVEIDDLHESSRIQRCGTTEHPRSKNGCYLFTGEGGWVQAWDGDCDIHWWDDPNKAEPTQAEKDAWKARKAAREADQQRLWGEAAKRAAGMLQTAKLKEHNYLHRKGLGDVRGMVLPDGKLFIPMRNLKTSALVGCQLIHWDAEERVWVKKYAYGSRPAGAVLVLGPSRATEIVLCEGYATGLSIDKALRQMRLAATILVCFNDSNMVTISKQVGGRVYVFADNDKSKAGESAAQATGLNYCMSPVEGEDANDLYVREGLTPVCNLIMEARKLTKEAA